MLAPEPGAESAAAFLLFHVERIRAGVVILCVTEASRPHRLRFEVRFPRPGAAQRALLWAALAPPKAPLGSSY